jgi:hypothetical protein
MKHAYKVWHSEQHKSRSKRLAGRELDGDEISWAHQHLASSLELNTQIDPSFAVTMTLLHPAASGVIIILESHRDSDAADEWMTRFLVRMNSLNEELCLIAEPLPSGDGPPPRDS